MWLKERVVGGVQDLWVGDSWGGQSMGGPTYLGEKCSLACLFHSLIMYVRLTSYISSRAYTVRFSLE